MSVGAGEGGREQGLVHVVSVISGDWGHSGVMTKSHIVRGGIATCYVMLPTVSMMVKRLLLDTGCQSRISRSRLRVSAASQTDAARSRRRGGQLVMSRGGLGVTARLFVQN